MSDQTVHRGRYLSFLFLLSLVAATLMSLLFGVQIYLYLTQQGTPVSFWPAVNWAMTDWYLWALFLPLILWCVRHISDAKIKAVSGVYLHILAGTGCTFIYVILNVAANQSLCPFPEVPGTFLEGFVYQASQKFPITLITYGTMAAITHAVDYHWRAREKLVRQTQLEAQLAQSQLQVLKLQLQPHFLFNTLNTISELVHRDAETADRTIVRLSELLRLSVDQVSRQEVPLREEMAFLEKYVEIEKTRFRDHLRVVVDIDPETLVASTPYLLLQPLVENAIRHGIATRVQPGTVTLRARRVGQKLILEVHDDGPGIQAVNGEARPLRGPGDEGIGISNTRARLHQLYGTAHSLEFLSGKDGGLTVRIEVPFQEHRGGD